MNKIKYIFYGTFATLAVIAVLTSILLLWRTHAKRECSIPILMYHEIGEAFNSPWCVPIEIFHSQMTSLREQGFQAILPSDIAAYCKRDKLRLWRGKPLPAKPVIITFDDGYLCNLTIVEPILKANGLRAVMYLITGQIAETAADRRQFEGKNCLVWPEVLTMQKRETFVFGGHSHTHANLVVDAEPLQQALECRRQLLLHGINEPYSFCYPYGQYNQETIKAVKQAGFQTAVVCKDAVATIGPDTDLFALPRVSVMGGSHEFRLINKRVEDGGSTLICRVSHAGIPIEISASLRGNSNSAESWLPAREVVQGEFELRFVLPAGVAGHEYNFVEIWDKHRLFKLATIGL